MSRSLPDHPEPATVPIRHGHTAAGASVASSLVQAEATAGETEVACPRCEAKLIDPGNLGWCAKCGYCKSIEQEAPIVPTRQTQTSSPLGALEFIQMLRNVPAWTWILLVGCLGVVVVSLVANEVLLPESFERAFWQAMQLAVGVLAILVGRIWAIILITAEESSIGIADVFFSWKLWKLTIKRLPMTRKPVWVGAWGLTAVLCAWLIIGGHEFWYQYYNPPKFAKQSLVDMTKMAVAEDEEDPAAAAEAAAKKRREKEELEKKKAEDKVDRRPTMDCVVIGFVLTEDRKDLEGLLLATDSDKKGLAFAGYVARGWTPTVKQNLLKLFNGRTRSTPFIPVLTQSDTWLKRGLPFRERVIWLKPEIFCEVHQSGWDNEGFLTDPNFKRLLDAPIR
jgi:hypothetical protein